MGSLTRTITECGHLFQLLCSSSSLSLVILLHRSRTVLEANVIRIILVVDLLIYSDRSSVSDSFVLVVCVIRTMLEARQEVLEYLEAMDSSVLEVSFIRIQTEALVTASGAGFGRF